MRIVILLLISCIFEQANAQRGDFSVVIAAPAETVSYNEVTNVIIHTCNNGADGNNYVANSLRITLSVGPNAEILGINNAASDQRWAQLSLSSGPNNTIRLSNKGGTLYSSTCGDISLNVRGAVVGNPSTITCTIGFIAAGNPLLGGAPNATQGNTSVTNDNSIALLGVTPPEAAPGTTVRVYPNPVTNYVTFTGVAAGSEIILTDIYGNLLQQQKSSGNIAENISVVKYANGQYLLSVINGTSKKTFMITKQ